jgi:hypothetical protein
LPLWGVTIIDKNRELFLPFFPMSDIKMMGEFLHARNQKVDMRLAALLTFIPSDLVKRDSSLEDGHFRIIVGSHDPTKLP